MTGKFGNQQSDGTQHLIFLQQLFVAIGSGEGNIQKILQANLHLLNRGLAIYLPLIFNHFESKGLPNENILGVATNVASCIQNCAFGNRAVNIEIAIEMNQMLVRFCTRRGFPKYCAMNQVNLGNAYRDRILENRRDNIEQAIQSYNAALKIITRQNSPFNWALIQNNLGIAYVERIAGEKKDNIELAIQAHHAALEVHTYSSYPYDWALCQTNLGYAYTERIVGGEKENIELAIKALKPALEILNCQQYSLEWALGQNNLGVAYYKRIEGERKDNIELAIQAHKASLNIINIQTDQNYWALNQLNLGNAYTERIIGERKDNIELAIEANHAALKIYTTEYYPDRWALSQNNLGNAYCLRIAENKANNIELAIQGYQQALKVYLPQITPYEWARTQNNLGNAYGLRIVGKKEDNLEQAIKFNLAALTIYTQEAYPLDWARTKENLGNAYAERIAGNKGDNLEQAINSYQASLEVYSQESFPYRWARAKDNLGVTHYERIAGNKEDNLEQAINSYQASLEVYTYQAFPSQWAKIQDHLGSAFRRRLLGEKRHNNELAIASYNLASKVFTRNAFPVNWAIMQNNLGALFCDLLVEEKDKNIETSIKRFKDGVEAYQAALEVFTPQTLPRENIRTAANLGGLFMYENKWHEAINTYNQAIESVEILRNWRNSDIDRQKLQKQAILIYKNTIRACIETRQIEKAIEYRERFCSRMLVDLVTGKELDRGYLKPEVQKLIGQYESLQAIIYAERQYLDNKIKSKNNLSNGDTPEYNDPLIQASLKIILELELEKKALYEEIREKDAVLAGEIQVNSLKFEQIQQLVDNPQTAIVSFYTIKEDVYIFILYFNKTPQYYAFQTEICLQSWLFEQWVKPYQIAFKNYLSQTTEDKERKRQWKESIPTVLLELAQHLNLNYIIQEYLQGIEELIIIPNLYLHNIPFAALPISDTEYLSDRFRIRHTPSCQILKFCQDRGSIANINYGTVEDADDSLLFARLEGQKVAQLFDIPSENRLIGKEHSTVTNYRQLASKIQVLHSSHHAASRLDNPLESALELADGNITLGELLLWRLNDLEEVFLSCCETNLGEANLTDDVLTLASGFLCAGARGVISSLWVATDLSSFLLSLFYYQFRKEGKSRPEALQQAQQKLRRLTGKELANLFKSEIKPSSKHFKGQKMYYLKHVVDVLSKELHPFDNPYYWAVFIGSGLA